MKRFSYRGSRAAVLLAGLVPLVVSQLGVAGEMTYRDIARRYMKNKDGAAVAKEIGFSKPVKHVVALDYTILLRGKDGVEKAVDVEKHQFRMGDQIRLRIEPLSNACIYIFHEGASGQRVCLLPTEQEVPPSVKGGETLALPDDGYFEFVDPPGKEKLLVVATEKPIADLALLSNVVFKKPGDTLTPEEQKIKDTFTATVNKTLESIRNRNNESITFRGLPSKESKAGFAAKVKKSQTSRAVIQEPPHGKATGTFTMVASTDKRPNLYVSIPLTSVRSKPAP